jgi:hypothetical protein
LASSDFGKYRVEVSLRSPLLDHFHLDNLDSQQQSGIGCIVTICSEESEMSQDGYVRREIIRELSRRDIMASLVQATLFGESSFHERFARESIEPAVFELICKQADDPDDILSATALYLENDNNSISDVAGVDDIQWWASPYRHLAFLRRLVSPICLRIQCTSSGAYQIITVLAFSILDVLLAIEEMQDVVFEAIMMRVLQLHRRGVPGPSKESWLIQNLLSTIKASLETDTNIKRDVLLSSTNALVHGAPQLREAVYWALGDWLEKRNISIESSFFFECAEHRWRQDKWNEYTSISDPGPVITKEKLEALSCLPDARAMNQAVRRERERLLEEYHAKQCQVGDVCAAKSQQNHR